MQIEYGERRDFWGYLSSLRYLEQSFRAVGIKVDINLNNFEEGKKYLCVHKGCNSRTFLLNDLTPEQAIKNVACFLASDLHGLHCELPKKTKEEENG